MMIIFTLTTYLQLSCRGLALLAVSLTNLMGVDKTLLPNVPDSFYSTPHAWELEEQQQESASKSSKSSSQRRSNGREEESRSKRNSKHPQKIKEAPAAAVGSANNDNVIVNADGDDEVVELAEATRRVRIDRRHLAMDTPSSIAGVNLSSSTAAAATRPSVLDRLGEKPSNSESSSSKLNTPAKKVFVLEKRNNRPPSSSKSTTNPTDVAVRNPSPPSSPPPTSKPEEDAGNRSSNKSKKNRNKKNKRGKDGDSKGNTNQHNAKVDDAVLGTEAGSVSTEPIKKKINISDIAIIGTDWNDIVEDQDDYDYTPIKWN